MAMFPPPARRPGDGLLPPRDALGIAAALAGVLGLVVTAGGAFLTLSSGRLSIAVFLGLLLAALAVVLGWAGRRAARRGLATNRGLAVTGVVLGLGSGLVVVVLPVLLHVGFLRNGRL